MCVGVGGGGCVCGCVCDCVSFCVGGAYRCIYKMAHSRDQSNFGKGKRGTTGDSTPSLADCPLSNRGVEESGGASSVTYSTLQQTGRDDRLWPGVGGKLWFAQFH